MKSRAINQAVALFGLFAFWSGAPVAAASHEVVPGEVLVGVRAASDDRDEGARLGAEVGRAMGRQGKIHAYRLQLRKGLSLEAAIEKLRRRKEVTFVEPNYVVRAASVPTDPYFATQQYGPQKVQADLAWSSWSPVDQIVVAVLDTGIDSTHPDLTNKIYRDAAGVVGYDALNGVRSAAMDDHGHGTHCAGVAAAQSNNAVGVAGIAGWTGYLDVSDTHFTKLMPVKVLSSAGSGSNSALADGIIWAADNGARIISMSLSGGALSSTVDSAIQYATSKGCVVVAAAGNSGSSAVTYPAGYNNVIAVAATDAGDRIPSYSNYGSWVDVAAPGGAATSSDGIYSTTPTYTCASGYPLNYGLKSGTSMATPLVAGEAALLLAQKPSLTPAQVTSLIKTNVDPYTYTLGGIEGGSGRVNVYRALQSASGAVPVPAPTPAPAAPASLSASAGDAKVTLSWSGVSGATSYSVRRSPTSGGAYTQVASVTSTSHVDPSLVNGTTYYYVVVACNSSGDSANSNQAAATPAAPVVVKPVAPTSLAAAAGKRKVSLTWNQSTSASITQNKVYRSVNGGSWQLLTTLSATTSYSDNNLQRGVTYSYFVTAVNSGGESSGSNGASAKPW